MIADLPVFSRPIWPSPGLETGWNSPFRGVSLASSAKVARTRIDIALNRQTDPMRLFAPSQTIFVRVPKNASNSIMAWLYPGVRPGALAHYGADFYRRVYPREFARYLVFAPLRHPLERFASAFSYYRNTSTIAAERALMDGELAGLRTLEDFVLWLNNQPDWSQIRLLYWHHFRLQRDYICDANGKLIVDLLFPVEDMSEGLRLIGRYAEVGGAMPRLNQSVPQQLGDLPLDRVRAHYAEDIAIWERAFAGKAIVTSSKLHGLRESA